MSLLEGLKALLAERVEHLCAVSRIDAELADVRAALGLTTLVVDNTAPEPSPAVVASDRRACERCGELFIPTPGAAGRFCSRACYAAVAPDDRRRLILAALAEGPQFAAVINDWPGLEKVSRATIHNDLYRLKTEGRVQADDAGYRLCAPPVQTTAPPTNAVETARDDADVVPFRMKHIRR